MTLEERSKLISVIIIIISLAITAVLYFVFNIIFLFVIFVPPLIYHLLKKRESNDQDISNRFGNSN